MLLAFALLCMVPLGRGFWGILGGGCTGVVLHLLWLWFGFAPARICKHSPFHHRGAYPFPTLTWRVYRLAFRRDVRQSFSKEYSEGERACGSFSFGPFGSGRWVLNRLPRWTTASLYLKRHSGPCCRLSRMKAAIALVTVASVSRIRAFQEHACLFLNFKEHNFFCLSAMRLLLSTRRSRCRFLSSLSLPDEITYNRQPKA